MEQLEKRATQKLDTRKKTARKKFSEFFENPFMQKDDDLLKSPAEAPVHRKVLLEDKDISPKTQKLLTNYVKSMTISSQKTVVT